jgi:hypothetical protein
MEAIPRYSSPTSVLTAAMLCVVSWIGISLFLLYMGANAIFGPLPWGLSSGTGVNVAMFLFFGSAIPYAIAAFVPRCDSCGKRFMVEGFAEKHASIAYRRGLNAWATTVMNVLRLRSFQCMYCGNSFRLK